MGSLGSLDQLQVRPSRKVLQRTVNGGLSWGPNQGGSIDHRSRDHQGGEQVEGLMCENTVLLEAVGGLLPTWGWRTSPEAQRLLLVSGEHCSHVQLVDGETWVLH